MDNISHQDSTNSFDPLEVLVLETTSLSASNGSATNRYNNTFPVDQMVPPTYGNNFLFHQVIELVPWS